MYNPPLTSTNCQSQGSVPDGTTCAFDCNDGYTLEEGVTVSCSTGTLDQPFPECNRKYIDKVFFCRKNTIHKRSKDQSIRDLKE